MSQEYNNNSVCGSSCSYANLSNYNNGCQGMRPPMPRGQTCGEYIVPNYAVLPGYGSNGYSTLMHGNNAPSCSGYFDIGAAYQNQGGNCNTKFMSKMCQ